MANKYKSAPPKPIRVTKPPVSRVSPQKRGEGSGKKAVLEVKKPKAMLTSPYSKPKSNLKPKTKDSVTKARLYSAAANTLTRIPLIQDDNDPANRNLRRSAAQNLTQAKSQAAAKRTGSQRSQMAVTRSRRAR